VTQTIEARAILRDFQIGDSVTPINKVHPMYGLCGRVVAIRESGWCRGGRYTVGLLEIELAGEPIAVPAVAWKVV
jgi:hypothetical protein